MNIIYKIYSNQGSGGPIDYSTAIASTSSLSYVFGPLAPSSSTSFAVRAYDTATQLEEANTEGRVRLDLDASGADVSGRPGPVHALTLGSTAAGGCLVSWAYAPGSSEQAPARSLGESAPRPASLEQSAPEPAAAGGTRPSARRCCPSAPSTDSRRYAGSPP